MISLWIRALWRKAAQNILGELKDHKGNDLDLSKIAFALYKNNLNNKLQAYTVKASYYLFNPETGKLELKHAVAPTYNVAALLLSHCLQVCKGQPVS